MNVYVRRLSQKRHASKFVNNLHTVMVWPIPFLINMFIALFYVYLPFLQLVLCHVETLKSNSTFLYLH